MSTKKIAAKLGQHRASICKHIAIIKTLAPTEQPPPPMKRSGKKNLSNDQLDKRLRQYVH
jgi:hypothetical protein